MHAFKSARTTYASSPFHTPYSQDMQPPLTMQGLPNPPPSIGYDVNEFRRFFQFGLGQLRYNNKYIINDLTTLASVYHHRMSTYIVKDIEQHIRESHPTHRLIGFYVLDSICKNLGHPFPELFKPFIERLFLIAFRDIEELDPVVKVKFEELLGTWRTGAANQTELFGADVQRRIEDGVFGSWRRGGDVINSQAFLSGIKQQPAVATPAEKASILYDLRRILAERERIAVNFPHDQANLTQMATLQQLEQLVANQQLTISQVEDIRQQLQPLKPPSPQPAPAEYAIPQPLMSAAVPQMAVHQPQPHAQPVADFADPGSLASLTRLLETNPGILLQAAQQTHHLPVPQLPSAQQVSPMHHIAIDSATQQALESVTNLQHVPAAPPPPGIAHALANPDLFDSQQLAAALASLNSQACNDRSSEVPSRERSIELTHQHSPAPSTLSNSEGVHHHPDPAVMEYENMVAGLDVELQSASINRTKPEDISEVLYSRIPQFCRQDGSRFLYGKTGDSRASEQLDRHFRLQRRARESGQRAQQRMWAQLETDWLDSHDFGTAGSGEGPKGRSRASNGHSKGTKSGGSEEKSMSELKKKSVIRPSSPGLASRPCPICREAFETRFDEDEDEFYWLNAIESTKEAGKRVVYHATCHYETIRNKARMRMRNELEEHRLKRSGADGKLQQEPECNVKKSPGVSRQATPTAVVEENLLQLDDSFFGAVAPVPTIKLEPISSPYSLSLHPHSSLLGKRKSETSSVNDQNDSDNDARDETSKKSKLS